MVNLIKTHNILNGITFSIAEFIIVPLIIAPFAIYYIVHGKVLLAAVAVGIILNCLTIVAFGIQQRRRKEQDLGIQHMFNKSVRERVGVDHPHLSRDTMVLSTALVLPYMVILWVIIELLWKRDDHPDQ